MSKEETPEITPQVVHLIDLLKRAREGRIRVPRFQREYVWRRQDISDLFDSITKQYPIGTLFLWGSDTESSSRDHIGPLKLPKYNGEQFLVLDGQQRLTTLVGVLLVSDPNWSDKGDDDPDRWKLYYDAETGVFTHASKEPIPLSFMPVTALMDTIGLFSLMQKMVEEAGKEERGKINEWVARAQDVGRSLQGYRIPIVEIKTDSLSIAVESFSRLNKKGRTIGQDEMFSALTYREGDFHLASEIDSLQQEMIVTGFGEVDRTAILRSVLSASELAIFRTDWTRLGEDLKKEVYKKLPQAVKEARSGLEGARGLLREIGILNVRMLPYSMHLVALSAFFGRCGAPSVDQIRLLKKWFWVSSFSGWFGVGNTARMSRLVNEFRDVVAKDLSPQYLETMDLGQTALPTPLRYDLRSARVRAMICVMLSKRPRGPNGTQVSMDDIAALLLQRGPEAMSTVCATVRNDDLRKSPANRIFDMSGVPGQAKNWVLAIDESVRHKVLESHAIPEEAFECLQRGDNDGFLKARLEEIARIEREFMTRVGVTLPESDLPAPSAIDTED